MERKGWVIDMEMEIVLSFAKMEVSMDFLGEDIVLTVRGGDRPHVGTAVLAVPRPSLSGDGSVSVTSSVVNVTGHKDELICRMLAEKAAKKYGVTAVCVGGFHVDGIKKEQIEEVLEVVRELELLT